MKIEPKTQNQLEGVLKGKVQFKKKSQVTIPMEIVKALGLAEGDIMECRLDSQGRIILVPTLSVPIDQAWYWSEQWQRSEAEVDQWKQAGKYNAIDGSRLMDELDHLDAEAEE